MTRSVPETPREIVIRDLAMLVRRLIRRIKVKLEHPNDKVAAQAQDYLIRHDLQGGVLRAAQPIHMIWDEPKDV